MSDQHIPGTPRTLTEPVPKEVRDEYVAAENDLFWLADHGALAGVAEILRERRRQIEQLGWTPGHDDRHSDGWLAYEAGNKLAALYREVADGTAGYPETEEAMRQAGALLAAEIDRLLRMLG